MLDTHIFLTGFMGSGKSTVGPMLAEALSIPFIDLDNEIVKSTGSTINNLFATKGEKWFRNCESGVLQTALTKTPAVVSTGGGIVIAPENRSFMHRQGVIVNLKVTLAQVLERLHGTNDRPLLVGSDAESKADSLLQEREIWYADADIRIDTNGKTVEDVVAEILNFLKGRNK